MFWQNFGAGVIAGVVIVGACLVLWSGYYVIKRMWETDRLAVKVFIVMVGFVLGCGLIFGLVGS